MPRRKVPQPLPLSAAVRSPLTVLLFAVRLMLSSLAIPTSKRRRSFEDTVTLPARYRSTVALQASAEPVYITLLSVLLETVGLAFREICTAFWAICVVAPSPLTSFEETEPVRPVP